MSELLNEIAKIEAERSDHRTAAFVDPAEPDLQRPERLALPDGTVVLDGQSAAGVGVDEIASRLWQRRMLLMCFSVAGLASGLMVTTLTKPVYRARTAVRLESARANPILSDNSLFSGSDSTPTSDSYVQNEIKILQSESLARRVGERLNLPQNSVSTRPISPLMRVLRRLYGGGGSDTGESQMKTVQRALTIRPSLKSQVVEIFFDASDAESAALGANTVISEYLAINREAESALAVQATERLSSQIAELKTKLGKENEDLKAFTNATGLLYSANQSALAEQRVSEIQEQLTKAEAERAAKQSRYEAAISNSPESLPEQADNNLLRDYQTSLAAAERELFQARSIYTPEHYKVANAELRVAQLRSSIQRERQNVVARLHSEYEAAARSQRLIANSFADQTRKLQSQSAEAFRYTALKHELDSTQQLYDALLRKSKEAGVASALQATSVRLIDPARPPVTPYSPNLPLNVAVGLGTGALLGIVTVLFGVHNPPPCTTSNARQLTIRSLGSIPDATRDPLFRPKKHMALLARPDAACAQLAKWDAQPLLAESYRSAVASIVFSTNFKHQHRVLVITSVEPQEGKTTVTANLGIALAESYGRVLLVDGDLRRPGLHKIFGQCNDVGLTSVLSHNQSIQSIGLENFLHPTSVSGLTLLSAGPGAASVTPLLHSVRMAQLLDRFRRDFDCILIDTPPTSLFSDARLLARLSDSVIMVVDHCKTSRNSMNSACVQLREDGSSILGTIDNRSNLTRTPNSYGYYQSYVE